MQLIRCTKKLRKEMGLKDKDLKNIKPLKSVAGGWHAHLIYIERRKCILFANDKTLFNFLVPDLCRAQIRELDKIFRENFRKALSNEDFDEVIQEKTLVEYDNIIFAKSNNRSVLGSMNDLAYQYKVQVSHQGGLQNCDFDLAIQRMNEMPMGALDYEFPKEQLKHVVDRDLSR